MLKTEDLNTMISIDEIHFADWQIWPQLRILLHRGKPVRISARAFDVLVVLVSARGKAVSKESLLTQVWGNEIVEENNLQAQISAIPAYWDMTAIYWLLNLVVVIALISTNRQLNRSLNQKYLSPLLPLF